MEELRVTLPAKTLPREYTCDGKNHSPRIGIDSLNTGITKSLALLVSDPDAPGGEFVHWVAWNLEPASSIPEKIAPSPELDFPIRAVQGTNSFGKIGYSGPCPPRGPAHHYVFRLYGLDAFLDLPAGATGDRLFRAMQGHIVQYGEAVAMYGR